MSAFWNLARIGGSYVLEWEYREFHDMKNFDLLLLIATAKNFFAIAHKSEGVT